MNQVSVIAKLWSHLFMKDFTVLIMVDVIRSHTADLIDVILHRIQCEHRQL